MKNRICYIYDDSCLPSYEIKNIIGEKNFGEIVYKRISLKERFKNILYKLEYVKYLFDLDNIYNINKIIKYIEALTSGITIIHMFSSFLVKDEDSFNMLIEKMQYAKDITFVINENNIALAVFPNKEDYIEYLKESSLRKNTLEHLKEMKCDKLEANNFLDINNQENFLQYMTSGFDARFFNSIKGDEYTVVKTSTNKKKIKMEYTFYYLLPDEMKPWFILPYNYCENENSASYTMERLHMTDIAVRWVHGAINEEEFIKLMDKLFYFVKSRYSRKISKNDYLVKAETLYIDKVKSRIEELKLNSLYPVIQELLTNSTDYKSLDEIYDEYKKYYLSIEEKMAQNLVDVIGHGDLCFSNMLYNKDTYTLKLIDTKGALEEKDIWTNPYYDLAKLSHSICGNYDFFNNGLYEIKLNENLKFDLEVYFNNSLYKKIFKKYLELHGYDYKIVRVLEMSLFLSMLPLHMDNPKKVLGFIMNATLILEEIKNGK